MPQLVKLHDDHVDEGFSVVATHVQNGTQEEIVKYLKSVKAKFTVTSFGRIETENKLEGIPAAYLFNRKGELIEAGRPADMKSRIVALIESEPHIALVDVEVKDLDRYAEAVKKTPSWSSILKKLDGEKKDDEHGAEATAIYDALLAWGTKELERARELESEDAAASYSLYGDLAKNFKGFEPGEKAKDRIDELKKDDAFQDELKAAQATEVVRKLLDTLSGDLNAPANKRTAAKIQGILPAYFKKFGESMAAARLKEDLVSAGFTVPEGS